MGMIREDGIETVPCTALAILEGYVYKIDSGSSYRAALATTVTDTPFGIAVSSSLDATGAAKTLTAGETANFYALGCGKKVKVAALTTETWHRGAAVYVSQSAAADGVASADSSNNAVKIGHYFGVEGLATTATGQLIDVMLDVAQGA